MASLSLPVQEGRASSPIAREVSGGVYALPENEGGIEAVGLEAADATTLVVRRGGRDLRLPCGYREWRPRPCPWAGRAAPAPSSPSP
jgi:hypothetical protein